MWLDMVKGFYLSKKGRLTLYGRDAYAYVVLDPERKGREIKNYY